MKNKILRYLDYVIKRYHVLKSPANKNIEIDDLNLFFLSGYDKSGTTWIKKTLNEVEGFSCIGSNQYFDYFEGVPESDIVKIIKGTKQRDSLLNISANHYKDFFITSYLYNIRNISNKKSNNYGEKSTAQDLNLIDYYFPNSRSIVLIRDMRDIIVSFAFHFDRRYKNRLRNWSQERSKFNVDGSIKDKFIDRELKKISNYYQHLLDYKKKSSKDVLFMRYEDLNSNNGFEFFLKILNFINKSDVNEINAKNAWSNNTFEKLSKGRKPGEKDDTSFFRSGTSKDYLNHLSKDQIKRINDRLSEYLEHFGYE